MADLSLVVNAGGASRRMGQPKALLPMPKSGLPLLAHIIHQLRPLVTGQIIVVANEPQLLVDANVAALAQLALDREPLGGPLAGMASGLARCTGWAMLTACDLPLIQPAIFAYLWELATAPTASADPWQAVVPVVAGHAQPLHALYHHSVLPVIEQALAAGERRAAGFLPQVATRWVSEAELRPFDPALSSFFNTNTPEEWAIACRVLNEGGETHRVRKGPGS